MRPGFRWRRWQLLPLALMGISAPGALGQTLAAMAVNAPGVNDAACRTMALPLVYAITLTVALGTLVGLLLVRRRLTKEGWSLANALSEPTRLTIPVQWRWTESAGDRVAITPSSSAASQAIRAADGTPIAMTLLEASSSRLIATLGGIGILMLYMGFGIFALYSFGLTCQLPGSMSAVTTFLMSGLSLFAPYVANKVSTAIQPGIRSASGAAGSESAAPLNSGEASPPESSAPTLTSPTRVADSLTPVGATTSASASVPVSSTATQGGAADTGTALPTTDSSGKPSGAATAEPVAGAASAPVTLAPITAPAVPVTAVPVAPVPVPPVPTAPSNATPPPTSAPSPQTSLRPQSVAPGSAASPDPADEGPALELIRSFEGFVDHAYPDPATGAAPWTIGYGFTSLNGQPVQPGQTISLAAANQVLQQQLRICSNHLAATIPYWQQMNSNQRCALLDFAWNLGADFYGDEANFATISRDLSQRDWAQVPHSLLLYCDPGTEVEAGLLRRRQAEAKLWSTPVAASTRAAAAPVAPAQAALANAPAAPASSADAASAPATPGRGAPGHNAAHDAASPNPLKVPYCDQLLMADGQGWRECFSASSAMLAMYWGKEPNENVYDQLRARYGDSTSSDAQLAALRALGLIANFQTDGTPELLKQQIDAGRPVAVGWLCDGPASSPTGGGHWSVIIGYDDTGFFINDPYGNCDLINGGYLSHHDGAGLHYSYLNWVPRWRVDGTGGWMLTCRP